jgi:predicted aspartyl protease
MRRNPGYALLVAAFAACAPAPKIPRIDGVVALPLYHLGSPHRFVKAEIGGREWLFLVDTGAYESAITPQAAHLMGLPITLGGKELVGIDGATDADRAVIPELMLGGLRVARLPVRVVTLSAPLLRERPELVAGYLGSDFLSRFHVGLDLAGGEMRLAPPSSAPLYPGEALRLPIRRAGGELHIDADIDGDSFVLELDTGADRLILFRAHRSLRGEREELFLGGVGPGAAVVAETLVARSLRFGEATVSDVDAVVVARDRQKGGLLGAEVLSRFRIDIDPRRQEILLWPRPPAEGAIDARLSNAPEPAGAAAVLEGDVEIRQ